MSYEEDPSSHGRIPFRLRIGVTGHRRLNTEEALAAQVRRALERIRKLAPSSRYTPVLLSAVSPLAEGADRLVTREVLSEDGADLEAVLPLPREEYLRDFDTDASRREFDELLAQAILVTVLDSSGGCEEAYERAGRYVVDRSDVMIALWDGQPSRGQGGTAETVQYARERRVPLLWILTEGQCKIVEEVEGGIGSGTFRQLDEYNRGGIVEERFERLVGEQQRELLDAAKRSGVEEPPVIAFSRWAMPYYARADVLAQRYQTWYHALGNALFLLAAAAVAAAASQVLFVPETPELVWIEVGLMIGLLVIVAVGRWWRLRDRWISYRFLAERFRSAFFMALSGLGGRREGGVERTHLGHPAEGWIRRAFGEVWNRRPRAPVTESDVGGLRGFLAEAWVQDQIEYHRRMSHKHRRRHYRLTRASEVLFGATLLAALLHAVSVAGGDSTGSLSWANLLILLAIALPALGGAISGIRMQREYLRNSERFDQMVRYLDGSKARMEAAQNMEAIRAAAADAEDLMLQENRDWFVVMKFHDFELHV